MKYFGLIALIPLLVVAANHTNIFGNFRSIFDTPNYRTLKGFRPTVLPRLINRIPVATPMTYSYPYQYAYSYYPYSYYPYSYYPYSYYPYSYYTVPPNNPVYVYYVTPTTMPPSQSLLTNLVGNLWPLKPGQQKPVEKPKEDAGHGDHFGYDEHHGPETWPEQFPTCGGMAQSPIDISLNDIEMKNFPRFVQRNYWAQPTAMECTNNGHSIQITGTWLSGRTPTVSGGPLKNDVYEFKQMHLHWGKNDDTGSEHTVNGAGFPMELHAVHWNTKYGTYDEAVKNSDGLTVLGFFFDIDNKPNLMMQRIINYFSKIDGEGGQSVKVWDPQPLGFFDLLVKKYVTYLGSLTTPPCSEIVTWLVNVEPLTISPEQMEKIRTVVKNEKHEDIHNFRPTQPLNGRPVYINA